MLLLAMLIWMTLISLTKNEPTGKSPNQSRHFASKDSPDLCQNITKLLQLTPLPLYRGYWNVSHMFEEESQGSCTLLKSTWEVYKIHMEYTPCYLHTEKTMLWANTSTMGLTIANFLILTKCSLNILRSLLDKKNFMTSEKHEVFYFWGFVWTACRISLLTIVPSWNDFLGVEEHLPPRI